MTVRCVSSCLILLTGLACACPVEAQGLHNFCESVVRDAKRNNCWPEPFLRPDRLAVRAPFVIMVNNGWRRQNMLAEHHFEEGAGTLNQAAELKIRWIMTEAPRQHRTIYVRRANTPELTAARIAAVQEYAVQFAEEGQLPTVLETNLDAAGWPAASNTEEAPGPVAAPSTLSWNLVCDDFLRRTAQKK